MKLRNKTIYTFSELLLMGVNPNTLNQIFYGRDKKKVGVKKAKVPVAKVVSYITEESFNKYIKHLIKPVEKK